MDKNKIKNLFIIKKYYEMQFKFFVTEICIPKIKINYTHKSVFILNLKCLYRIYHRKPIF